MFQKLRLDMCKDRAPGTLVSELSEDTIHKAVSALQTFSMHAVTDSTTFGEAHQL